MVGIIHASVNLHWLMVKILCHVIFQVALSYKKQCLTEKKHALCFHQNSYPIKSSDKNFTESKISAKPDMKQESLIPFRFDLTTELFLNKELNLSNL